MQNESHAMRLARQAATAIHELEAHLAAEESNKPARPERPLAEGEGFVRLKDFLKELGVSYSSYRLLRAEGKMPQEMRLSKRTIIFSRAEIDRWREEYER